MGIEYAEAAEGLGDVLTAVHAAEWEGVAAEAYIAANAPFVAWLIQTSSDSAARAAQHTSAAAAYTAALAAMPTLPELAANHAAHTALVSTNFFGLNSIPIALNEADYARMWIQAATTMEAYCAVSTAALVAAPPTRPAPQIMKSVAAQHRASPSAGDPYGLQSLLDDLFNFEGGHSLLELIWPGNPFTSYPQGTTLLQGLLNIWTSFYDGLFVYDPQTLAFAHNPLQLIAILLIAGVQLITHRIFDILQLFYNFPQLLVAALPLAVAPLGTLSGFAGLAGLASITPSTVTPVAAAPIPEATLAPAVTIAPIASSPAPALSPAPTAGVAPGAPPASPPPASPPVLGVESGAYPYLVGPPGVGFGSGMHIKVPSSASEEAAAPASAVAAMAVRRSPARMHRRPRAPLKDRGYRYEYVSSEYDLEHAGAESMNDAPADSVSGSGQDTGTLGLPGTANKDRVSGPMGFAAQAGNPLGGDPKVPMLPGNWPYSSVEYDNGR